MLQHDSIHTQRVEFGSVHVRRVSNKRYESVYGTVAFGFPKVQLLVLPLVLLCGTRCHLVLLLTSSSLLGSLCSQPSHPLSSAQQDKLQGQAQAA